MSRHTVFNHRFYDSVDGVCCRLRKEILREKVLTIDINLKRIVEFVTKHHGRRNKYQQKAIQSKLFRSWNWLIIYYYYCPSNIQIKYIRFKSINWLYSIIDFLIFNWLLLWLLLHLKFELLPSHMSAKTSYTSYSFVYEITNKMNQNTEQVKKVELIYISQAYLHSTYSCGSAKGLYTLSILFIQSVVPFFIL